MRPEVEVVAFYMVRAIDSADMHRFWYQRSVNVQFVRLDKVYAAQQKCIYNLSQYTFVPFAHHKIYHRFAVRANGVGYPAIIPLVFDVSPYFIQFESCTVQRDGRFLDAVGYPQYFAQYRTGRYTQHPANAPDAHAFTYQQPYLPFGAFQAAIVFVHGLLRFFATLAIPTLAARFLQPPFDAELVAIFTFHKSPTTCLPSGRFEYTNTENLHLQGFPIIKKAQKAPKIKTGGQNDRP